jgi:hypothetical protein
MTALPEAHLCPASFDGSTELAEVELRMLYAFVNDGLLVKFVRIRGKEKSDER